MAFFGGTTGVIYRQFSITLVTAMVLSLVVALTFTPALCATILKQHDPKTSLKATVSLRVSSAGLTVVLTSSRLNTKVVLTA